MNNKVGLSNKYVAISVKMEHVVFSYSFQYKPKKHITSSI